MEAHAEWAELAATDALGALDPDDRERLARHLATGCAACRRTRRDAESALARIAATPAPIEPSRALRRRVIASSQRGNAS